jgi:hypothetical protein
MSATNFRIEDANSKLEKIIKRIQVSGKNENTNRVQPHKLKHLFLPGTNELMRAMPNHIARSSLFAPVARGKKQIYKDAVLITRGDAIIKFSGEQLDESQADVWMQAIHEAMKVPFGEPVIINRATFLKSIGRQTGYCEYKWLHKTMETLAFAMLVINVYRKNGTPKLTIGHIRAIHMIEGFDFDNASKIYTLRIDPRWGDMFVNREYALIDWKKRLQFGLRQDMAKSLQRLVATSADKVQRFSLDWLKSKLQYNSPMRKFKTALTLTMKELERLEIISGGEINKSTKGKEQAVWTKL